MKRKVLSTLAAITILAMLFVSCKQDVPTSDETPNQSSDASSTEEATTPSESIDFDRVTETISNDDTESVSTIEAYKTAYNAGEIDEATYHYNLVQLVVAPESVSASDKIVIREGEPIDLSNDVQWMIDHYDDLNDDGKALVDQLTDYDLPSSNTSSVTPSLFGLTAHASDLEKLYPIEIHPNVYLTHPLPQYPLDMELEGNITGIIENVYSQVGKSLGKNKLTSKIIISTYHMIPGADSYSFKHLYVSDDHIEEVFVIHLNSSASADTLMGAMIHEMYHGYQFEMGYNRSTELEKFLMESTAIWAVKNHDITLEYPDRYDKYIYEKAIFLEAVTMSENQKKSWYQFYYMMENDATYTGFVKKILENGLSQDNLIDTLAASLDTEVERHDVMAWFAQALFLDAPTSDRKFPPLSPYWGNKVNEDEYEARGVEELITKEEGSTFTTETLIAPGYYPVIISFEDYPDSIVDIISNIESLDLATQTGLAAYGEKDGQWKVIMKGEYTSFTSNIDLNKDPIDHLLLVFFSYNTDQTEHKYAVNLQTRIVGEGHISVSISTEALDPSDGVISDERNYNIEITENIELIANESVSDDMAIMQLILGDIYYVENFQAIFNGNAHIEYGNDSDTKYDYNGEFMYNDGEAAPGAFPNNLLSFDLSSMFAVPDGSGSTEGGALGDMMSGLEGMTDIEGLDMPDMDGLMDELEAAQGQLTNDLADIGTDMDMLLPNPNKLQRMKEILESETFHLYQTMPPNFTTEPWIDYKKTHKYIDEDGKRKTDISNDVTLVMVEALPLWFRNIHYDPDQAEMAMDDLPQSQEEFAASFTDISSVMDQVLVLNGQFDVSNLYNSFDTGPYTFDLKEVDESKEGEQTQELILTDDGFIGTIEATYIEFDVEHEVSIQLDYTFK